MNTRNAFKLIIGLTLFTLLSGFHGCTYRSGTTASVTSSSPTGSVVVTTVVDEPAPVLTGDLALTIFAPKLSGTTAASRRFNLTLREGGAFGPIVIEAKDFEFDAFGVGTVDISDLSYGFYDLEVIGLDMFGTSTSYAATGVSIDEPFSVVSLSLEPALITGDVVMELMEPDAGMFAGPIDSIDYTLWEVDEITGQLTIVETMVNLQFDPWNPPVIPALGLGTYHLELLAFDMLGDPIYGYSNDFTHNAATTFLPVTLFYY